MVADLHRYDCGASSTCLFINNLDLTMSRRVVKTSWVQGNRTKLTRKGSFWKSFTYTDFCDVTAIPSFCAPCNYSLLDLSCLLLCTCLAFLPSKATPAESWKATACFHHGAFFLANLVADTYFISIRNVEPSLLRFGPRRSTSSFVAIVWTVRPYQGSFSRKLSDILRVRVRSWYPT